MSKVTNIFSKCSRNVDCDIQVRDRKDIEVVYTYAIRYNLGSTDDTIVIGTNTFSYEEAVSAATQLIGMDYAKGMDRASRKVVTPDGVGPLGLFKLKDSKVLDIELIEVHINYE